VKKFIILILIVFIIYNAGAQAPPPAPLDEFSESVLDGNLLLLIFAGVSYSFKKIYNYTHQVKNNT
jgi:hypothetical protein